ncbi:MAG TPA: cobalt transporter [Devosia sp.]|nr:cobalt transporter [Devosia sp.]
MEMFRRIFFAAVLAGAVAGLVASAIQQWRVVPLILEAERYEISEAHAIDHEQDATPAAPHLHELPEGMEPWSPADGLERTFYTVLATTLAGLGFALLMGAVSTFASIEITAENALFWSVGGFLAFSLMPAIGLPPDLPGMAGAELTQRQFWWLGTAFATGAAALLVAKLRNLAGAVIALVVLLAPHIIGAPTPPDVPADVPAHLATAYAANTLFSSFVFWLVLGAAYGWINRKLLAQETSRDG